MGSSVRMRWLGAALGVLAHTCPDGIAQAEYAPVVDGIPQPIVVDDRLADGFLLDHWHAAMRDAIAGDCAPVLSFIGKKNWDGSINYIRAEAELLDHGLCLEFDPKGALHKIEELEHVNPGLVALRRGWKGFYGHGVPQAMPEVVRAEFIRYLLSIADHPFYGDNALSPGIAATLDALFNRDMGGRPVPSGLADGLTWLKVQLLDEGKRLELARAMIWGGGVYYDGARLTDPISGKDPESYIDALSFRSADAALVRAEAIMQNRIKEQRGPSVYMNLFAAAQCLQPKAILYLIRFHISGEYEAGQSTFVAAMWLKVGLAIGIPAEDLTEAVGDAKLPLRSPYDQDIPRILARKDCKL